MLRVSDFVHNGHFVLESGDHGETWLDLDRMFGEPRWIQKSAAALAQRLDPYEAEVVCGPLDGGAFLAQWVAWELGVRFAYARREPGPRYVVPDGLVLSGDRVILVDDAVDAGAAAAATNEEIVRHGGAPVVLASLLVCTPRGREIGPRLGLPQLELVRVPHRSWAPHACPLCLDGVRVRSAP